MEILLKKQSQLDDAMKYVFKLNDDLIAEVTYINKHDGKYILCLPSQTGCNLKCKFCFLTDLQGKMKVRNINRYELDEMIMYIVSDLQLDISRDNMLLLSFMGSGEPTLNQDVILCSKDVKNKYVYVRSAIATMMPNIELFNKFMGLCKQYNIDMKVHLSLHYVDDSLRKEWMPSASPIEDSVKALIRTQFTRGNEIHYTLIDGVNDSYEDIDKLIDILKQDSSLGLKFLRFNPHEDDINKPTPLSKVKALMLYINKSVSNQVEEYLPPAGDIKSSCGQFLLDLYKEFNLK